MLGLAAAYYAVPLMRGLKQYDERLGRLGFWLVFTGILGIGFAFALGGTVQVFVYRTLGLDWFGGDVFPAMGFFKALLPVFGTIFTIGSLVIVYDLITLGSRVTAGANAAHNAPASAAPAFADPHAAPVGAPATGWGRYLSGHEAGPWPQGMWCFGALNTFGRSRFNRSSVPAGDNR